MRKNILKNEPSIVILNVTLTLLVLLFCLSLFKNISYPLLWADEADTAMFATRILEYGYPKVHDGKNVLYVFPVDMKLGIREKFDLYIANPLLGYYWAVPGAFLATLVENLYDKTMLLRIPFAVTGLIALFIFALLPQKIFSKKPSRRLWFLILFVLLELFSISLVLHLREVRYYSPLILFTAGVLYLYLRYRIQKREEAIFAVYVGSMAALLFLIFNTFYPLFFILIATLCLYEFLCLLQNVLSAKKEGRVLPIYAVGNLKPFLPFAVSIMLTFPLMIYFRTFEILSNADTVTSRNFEILFQIFKYLTVYEFLPLALFFKAALAAAVFWKNRPFPENITKQIRISNFLTLFFVIHLIALARLPFVFTRYFIVLQPVLTLILLLDAFAVFELLSKFGTFANSKKLTGAFIFLSIGVFFLNFIPKIDDIKGHAYELTHRYRGPLDFAIPYIKNNYPETENLVIATNYEEHCYMYYLGSKVIIGFIRNNLKDDLQEIPDIIIYRKSWPNSFQALQYLFSKARYKAISFPVADYKVNNIPELYFILRHLYRTPDNFPKSRQLMMYVKMNNAK